MTLSGGPYAKRPWDLSQKIEKADVALDHPMIAVVESFPIIGGLVALVERIIVFIYDYFFNYLCLEASSSLLVTHLDRSQQIPFSNGVRGLSMTEPKKIADKRGSLLSEKAIIARVLKDIPVLKKWHLSKIHTVALGLLYHAMKDKNHPSFITEELQPNLEFDETAAAMHAIEFDIDIQTLKVKCAQYHDPIARIKRLKNYMEGICIEMSSEEMIDAFNKYGIVQLRPVQHFSDVLVLGCGNTPSNRCHYRGKDESHDHMQADTVNIHIDMNPSVVAFWGYESNDAFFTRKQHKYRLIVDEGPICAFLNSQGHIDQFFRAVRGSLQPQGYLALPSHAMSFSIPPDFVRSDNSSMKETAQKQNFHTIALFQYMPK